MDTLRIAIRVKPGAHRRRVGGTWGPQEALVVAVAEPATGGRANRAVLAALADALEVPVRTLAIAHGTKGRDKQIEVGVPPADIEERVLRLKSRD